MKNRVCLWSVILLAIVAVTSVGHAQVFKADVDGSVANPNTITQAVTVAPNATVTSYVILTGAANMLGANCDLVFPNNLLELVSITEQVGDINFDGLASLQDVLIEVSYVGLTSSDPEYISYYDKDVVASPGVIALGDVLTVVSGVGVDKEFWVNNDGVDLTPFGGFRESVEIYDPVAVSNAAGKIDDIVAVLLARPEVRADTNLLNQFAFDGDAVMAEVVFRALATGTATLSFQEPVMLDTDDDPSNPTAVTGENSTITIQQ